MEALIRRFNNLGGRTIGEHKNAFNSFKKDLDALTAPEIDLVLSKIVSNTNQEHIFRVVLLKKYQKNDHLLQVLYSGNKILSKLIVKDPAFIRSLFREIKADSFVNEVCPKISYVNRRYIINMLANHIDDAAIGDAYYRSILEKYGFAAASALLVVCSEALVRQTISEYKLNLNDRQIVKLYKKYPDFLDFYFETCSNKFTKHSILGQKLALYEIETFNRMLKFGEPKIGKRAFCNYIRAYKQNVINQKYYANKHISLVYKCLSEHEFALYFKNSCPKLLNNFILWDAIQKLKVVPISLRGKLLFATYLELYEVPFDEYATNLLSILSLEDRLKFDIKPEDIEFFAIDKSIPLIKERITLTSDINLRSELINKLIKTCKINNDKEALTEVLKYFVNRHKNDNLQVRQNFLSELCNEFQVDTLNDECWKYITDLMLLFEVNSECFYNSGLYLEKLINKKMKGGEDYKPDLLRYFKEKGMYGSWRISELKAKYQKECITAFADLIPQLVTIHGSYENLCVIFVATINDWNKTHRKDNISYYDYPEILRTIFKELDKPDEIYQLKYTIRDMICFIPKRDEDKALHNEFFEKYMLICTDDLYKLCPWILKNKPDLIIKYLEQFLKMKSFKLKTGYFYEVSKMHFTELPNVIYSGAIKLLEANDCSADVLTPISYLSYTGDFLNLITKFHPEPDCKINIHDKSVKDLLKIRRRILTCFKHISVPFEDIDIVLRYCNKDYLQYALEPLYFIMNHSPEQRIEKPLNELLTRAVSVRKHTIYLATTLGDVNYVIKTLKEIGSSEKNVSIQKFIFKRTYMFFCGNPSEIALELLIAHLALLNCKDKESFDMLTTFNKIPYKYLASYLRHIYNFLKSMEGYEEFHIISHITKEILQLLPSDFCDQLIKDCLFNKHNFSNIKELLYNYFMYSGDLMTHRFKVLSDCIKNAIDLNANYIDSGKILKEIYGIVKSLCVHLISDKNEEKAIALGVELQRSISSITFPLNNNKLEFEILLQTTVFHARIRNWEKLADYFVNNLGKSIYETYGYQIDGIYRDFVIQFVSMVIGCTEGSRIENRLKFADNFTKIDDSNLAKLLALEVMPLNIPKTPYFKRMVNAAISPILENCKPVVKVYVDAYLRQMY